MKFKIGDLAWCWHNQLPCEVLVERIDFGKYQVRHAAARRIADEHWLLYPHEIFKTRTGAIKREIRYRQHAVQYCEHFLRSETSALAQSHDEP